MHTWSIGSLEMYPLGRDAALITVRWLARRPDQSILWTAGEFWVTSSRTDAYLERLEESLGYVGMDLSVLARYPHQLSGGQRQRVMIARALMMRPELLIADEATSMLDASLRVNVLNVLKDLRDQLGMTVLFITHDIGQACYLADRVLVMEHGVMVEQGKTDEVIFNPQHEYTKRLLADVPKLHEELELHDLREELQQAGELA
jgi:ABC-type oligopeptide transport system ATPase subunit